MPITSATRPPNASSSNVPGSGTVTPGPAHARVEATRPRMPKQRAAFMGHLFLASIADSDHQPDYATEGQQFERSRFGYGAYSGPSRRRTQGKNESTDA